MSLLIAIEYCPSSYIDYSMLRSDYSRPSSLRGPSLLLEELSANGWPNSTRQTGSRQLSKQSSADLAVRMSFRTRTQHTAQTIHTAHSTNNTHSTQYKQYTLHTTQRCHALIYYISAQHVYCVSTPMHTKTHVHKRMYGFFSCHLNRCSWPAIIVASEQSVIY